MMTLTAKLEKGRTEQDRPTIAKLGRRTVLASAVSLALGGSAMGATIPVGGGCSLVDAITAANTDTATGGCPAGSGSDIITLPSGSTHTLTAVDNNDSSRGPNGLPSITSTITVQGNGATVERSSAGGTPAFRIFRVGTGGDLVLEDLTVRNGYLGSSATEGGGILVSEGSLTLNRSTVTGNQATWGGGIYNESDGTTTLNDSTVLGNSVTSGGAGIYNNGSLELNNTTVTGNTSSGTGGGIGNFLGTTTLNNSIVSGNSAAQYGGGLYNYNGVIVFANSTISGNSAGLDGGGFYNSRGIVTLTSSTVNANSANFGGGVYNGTSDGEVTLTNSTVSGNSANYGGGLYNGYGTVTLTNSTVSGNGANNGGGLANYDGAIALTNSIVANSAGGDCAGDITDNGNNWFEDDTCNGVADGDPNLGPLADNGGSTRTHALLAGSGAIDAADLGTCTSPPVNGVDQRGEPRPEPGGSACDIGAYERQAATPPAGPVAIPTLSLTGLLLTMGALLGIAGRMRRRQNGQPPS